MSSSNKLQKGESEKNNNKTDENFTQDINASIKLTEHKLFTCRNSSSRVSNRDHRIIFDTFHEDRHYKLDELLYDIKTGVFTNRSVAPLCLNVSFGFPQNNVSTEHDITKTWVCHSILGDTAVGQTFVLHLMPGETFHCCFRQENRHVLIMDQPKNAYIHICRL